MVYLLSPPQKELLGGFPPDKSSGPLWSLAKSLWKPVLDRTSPVRFSGVQWIHRTSPVKPGNGRFGVINTSTFPNIFDASLLIVWLSYDLNKI
jgi:hypothetical protein